MPVAAPERSPVSRPVSGSRGLSRDTRRGLVLLVVAALSVPLVLAPDRIAIAVDGDLVQMRSYAGTVQEALVAAGVEVGRDDRVVPSVDAPVADGLGIEVTRAVTVALAYQGRTFRVPVAGDTVRDVLVAAGIGDVRGLSVTPDPDTPLSQTRRVEVVEPVTVRIRVDGGTDVVHMRAGTVGDALDLAGIRVRASDTLSLPRDQVVQGDDVTVEVTRHDTREVVEEVTLPFHEQVVPTDELYEDQQVVVREGAEGLRRDTYRVTLVNGEPTGRELVSQEVVAEAVDRVVHVGTAARPAPAPEPAPSSTPQDDSVWDRLAACESGGNWGARGTYHGGLQFHPDTWNRWKPAGYPTYAYEASREQQIEVGRRLQAARGWSPWPHCASKLGLQ